MQAGYVSIPETLTGNDVYREFIRGSTETVRFHIEQIVDGVRSDLDLSSANLRVYFRARNANAATILIDTLMTKANAAGGLVTADIKFANSDWANNDVCEWAVVIANLGAADGDTQSGYTEYVVYGVSQAIIRDSLVAV